MGEYRRHNVVIAGVDQGIEVHPMKEWVRQHPGHLPPDMDLAVATSHQIRNALHRAGWTVQELPGEIRVFQPGDSGLARIAEEVLGPAAESDEAESQLASFALEAQLRDFIAENLPIIKIAGNSLTLYADPEGRLGIEYATGVGPIDILAVDASGTFYVFELKLDRGPDRALGQLARYMGWITRNLARGNTVRGVLVAKTIDEKLRYAVSVVPNVLMLEYEVDFRLSEVTL